MLRWLFRICNPEALSFRICNPTFYTEKYSVFWLAPVQGGLQIRGYFLPDCKSGRAKFIQKPAVSRADKFIPLIKAKPGNKGCQFLMDDETDEYGMVIFWDTKENAEAAKAAIGPELVPMLHAIATEPVKIKLYEAYEG